MCVNIFYTSYKIWGSRCPKFRKTSPSTNKNPQHIFQLCLITKLTINGLLQLNFESETIVIFVILKHMCAQLEDLLHILRGRFWKNNTRCIDGFFYLSEPKSLKILDLSHISCVTSLFLKLRPCIPWRWKARTLSARTTAI